MSSKTQKGAAAKTVWARKYGFTIAFVLSALAVVFVSLSLPSTMLRMGDDLFFYEVADTPATQEQGLSGRDSLPTDRAMLFVFKEPGQHCFWMKDMKFPIDIIWLDSHKNVVYVKESANPASYPETFCPEKPAKYVIEVTQGVANYGGLKQSGKVRF